MATSGMNLRWWSMSACLAAAAGMWLGPVGVAGADPAGDAMTPPGNPAPAAEAAPAVAAPQQVPEIANPVYGSGQYGSGPLGTLRDLWHQAHDPYGANEPEAMPGAVATPAGAGPAPALPPGYVSINAPGSETVSSAPKSGGPELPPGYFSLDGPAPPGYEYAAPEATTPAAG